MNNTLALHGKLRFAKRRKILKVIKPYHQTPNVYGVKLMCTTQSNNKNPVLRAHKYSMKRDWEHINSFSIFRELRIDISSEI